MDVKGKVLLQLFNKRRLRNGTKKYLEQFFLFIVKFKKLGFSAPFKHNKDQLQNKYSNFSTLYKTCVAKEMA